MSSGIMGYNSFQQYASYYNLKLGNFKGCGETVSVSVAYTRTRSDYADIPCGDAFRSGSGGGIETERAICEGCFTKNVSRNNGGSMSDG